MKSTTTSNVPKLDFWRTLCVGFAFMGIMCFWEVYDYIMPLILNRNFGMNAAQYGLVMGLDNMLAIFLLPLFGALSDRYNGKKYGRRTPFIFWGTIAAVICIVALGIVEYVQYSRIGAGVQDLQTLTAYGLDPKFLGEEYTALVQQVADGVKLQGDSLVLYNEYCTALYAAQSAYAAAVTKQNVWILIVFIGVLLVLLVAMSSYRSPAVALMPDVTPKPLRSQANAVITLMGGAGGMFSIILYKLLAPNRYQHHIALFIVLAVVMLVILAAFLLSVRENKLVALRAEAEARYNIVDEEEVHAAEPLSRSKMLSLGLILATVFLWFMGYNAVKTHLSVYATTVLNLSDGLVGTINIVNGVGGAIALFPVALLASRFGRKITIIGGLVLSALAFVPCMFFTANTPGVSVLFPLCFILSGFGLVCVNVNTFPMATELSKGSNVGKYTGFYYISSMGAQAITPVFAGVFMDWIAPQSVFVYSVVFIVLALVAMAFTKHGDNKPERKAKIIEYFGEED